MARRPIDERGGPATETLTLRLSPDDRDLLNRLVALRAAELTDEGLEVSAASYVRGLIRREARAKGLLDEQDRPKHSAPSKTAKPSAPAKPKPPTPAEPAADEVRAALVRAIEGGAVQGDIAKRAGIDRGHLSRFKAGKGGLSPESLRKLAAVVKPA